ncbi:MAG: hypothetical protein OXF86_15845 [Caldilineaceae bacterium]|nr:hypothetical protein [Caldilineaceae bacterium]
MKRVVSISLGSSKRNKRVETTIRDEEVVLERIGADGDQKRMRQLFLEYDGQVDAFGFGGADLGLEVNDRYFPLHSVRNIVAGIQSPVVDGGGIRTVVERQTARRLQNLLPPHSKNVLFCVAVGRYAMVRGFLDMGYQPLFGDLAFGLGIPVFLRSLSTLHLLAGILLPVMSRLPFSWIYPTGEKQEQIVPKFGAQYSWASIIADDFHYIRQHLPSNLEGKTVVTNTTTDEDVALLKERGVSHLATVTPRLDGRSFGTNVMEAALTALAGKGRPLSTLELQEMLDDEGMTPSLLSLAQ